MTIYDRAAATALRLLAKYGEDVTLRRLPVGVYDPATGTTPLIGTGVGYTTNATGYAIGATAITLISGTGSILASDLVSFAGDTNKYPLAAGITAPGVLTLAAPGLLAVIPASAQAVTNYYNDGTRRAATFDYPRMNQGQVLAGQTLIQQGDRQCLMDANGAAPTLADHVIVDSIEYVIKDIKTLSPAGTPVLYELQLRK